ncbi:MAG: hypothetical protein JSW72_01050 [Candidatus Bathyarchaeota archaeon]|nr:MAG: hypothetical protein JSW72_01050 [Candidatus Bathyarchaeota archaeon]
MSRRGKNPAVRILLALLGPLWGWVVASYAYVYFVENGVTSDYSTGYSAIVWLAVLGTFGLIAFKGNLRE